MKTLTADTITDAQIVALRDKAIATGDDDLRRACTRALTSGPNRNLGGEVDAFVARNRGICAAAINAANGAGPSCALCAGNGRVESATGGHGRTSADCACTAPAAPASTIDCPSCLGDVLGCHDCIVCRGNGAVDLGDLQEVFDFAARYCSAHRELPRCTSQYGTLYAAIAAHANDAKLTAILAVAVIVEALEEEVDYRRGTYAEIDASLTQAVAACQRAAADYEATCRRANPAAWSPAQAISEVA